MISRHWRGIAKPSAADSYIDHLRRNTFPGLDKIDGFIRASILRREVSNGVEFLIVTTWQSMEAIQKFAGESADIAVVPPVVQGMMIQYDKHVVHYDIVGHSGASP